MNASITDRVACMAIDLLIPSMLRLAGNGVRGDDRFLPDVATLKGNQPDLAAISVFRLAMKVSYELRVEAAIWRGNTHALSPV